MILKTIKCDLCSEVYTESAPGAGFPQWGELHGISLDGFDNPSLCPSHLAMIADFLDEVKKQNGMD